MPFWVWLAIGIIVGFVFGYCLSIYLRSLSIVGTLREDQSDPTEAPYLFLELNPGGIDAIHKNKVVALRVQIRNYISRKE